MVIRQGLERTFFVSTSSVWRMVFENRGPIATYSSSRSMSSRITIDSGDCAAKRRVKLSCEYLAGCQAWVMIRTVKSRRTRSLLKTGEPF